MPRARRVASSRAAVRPRRRSHSASSWAVWTASRLATLATMPMRWKGLRWLFRLRLMRPSAGPPENGEGLPVAPGAGHRRVEDAQRLEPPVADTGDTGGALLDHPPAHRFVAQDPPLAHGAAPGLELRLDHRQQQP